MAKRSTTATGCLAGVALLVAALLLLGIAAYGLGFIPRVWYVTTGAQERGAEALNEQLAARMDMEFANRYHAYAQLGENDRRCYRIMYDAMVSRESRAYPEEGADSLDLVRASVVADHPELFYVDGVRLLTTYNPVSDLVTSVSIEGSYTYSEEEVSRIQPEIQRRTWDFLATLPPDADDYAKAKAAYEYIVLNTEYDHDVVLEGNPEDGTEKYISGQTIANVFVDGLAVCAGYSAAFQHLMQASGIQCTQVLGVADGERHAWCLVKLDGAYYFCDPTWGDPEFMGVEEALDSQYVNYAYLAVTSEDMEKTHTLDEEYAVPRCADTADNYFVREGLMLVEADEGFLGSLVAQAESGGVSCVQVECADQAVFDALVDDFLASGRLGSYLDDGMYQYATYDEVRAINVFP